MADRLGGRAIAAHYMTDADIAISGLEGGFIAAPVYGVDILDPTEGGSLVPVYVIDEADLIENGGRFRVGKGTPVPINTFISNRRTIHGPASPVYLMNGDAGRTSVVGDPTTNTNTGTDLELFVPYPVEQGDYLVAELRYAGSGGATITKPGGGWSTIYEAYAGGLWLGIYTKFVTGADTTQGSSYTWAFDESADSSGGMVAYRCVNVDSPINVVGPTNNGSNTQPKGKSVTPSVEGTRILYFVGAAGDVTYEAPPGYVEQTDTNNGNASGGSSGKGKKDKTPTGDQTGTLSTTATWQTVMLAVAPCGSEPLPAPPTSLAVSAVTASTITLTWFDQATNELDYSVERSSDGVSYAVIATPTADVETYQNTGLGVSETWFYRVRARNNTGYSQYSDAVSGTTTAIAIPTAPSGLTVGSPTTTTLDLAWTDNSADEDGFKIERSLDDATWAQIDTVAADVVVYTDTALSASTLYYYRVRAYNGGGNSAYTTSASDTTSAAGSSVDPGTMEYWQAGELPAVGPNGIDSGTFEYWQAGELPPALTVI